MIVLTYNVYDEDGQLLRGEVIADTTLNAAMVDLSNTNDFLWSGQFVADIRVTQVDS